MGDFYCVKLSALDGFDRAIVRFSPGGSLTYANAAGQHLLGGTVEDDITLDSLLADDTQRQLVRSELGERRLGKASVYDTLIRRRRPFDGIESTVIPISVYAFPESNAEDGFSGSLAMLRDRREDIARDGIHRAIESCLDNETLLARLDSQLRPLVAFDEMRVTIVSKSRLHVRRLYSSDQLAAAKYPFRWYPMQPFMQRQLNRRDPRVRNIEEMRIEPDYAQALQTEYQLRQYFDSGVRQILTLPVVHDGRVVATFSLDSHTDGRYDSDTLTLLQRLPIVDAVMVAVGREEKKRHDAVLKLLRNISASGANVNDTARQIVEQVAADFGWDSVAIFQGSDNNQQLRLVSQGAKPGFERAEGLRLEAGESAVAEPQEAVAGPIAAALLTRSAVYMDLPDDAPWAAGRVARGVRSMAAVKVPGRKAHWVVVVESKEQKAFSHEELDVLERLASETAAVLHRSALFEMQTAVLASIDDAVIETSDDGQIRWLNAAARRLLGWSAGAGTTAYLNPKGDGPMTMDDLVLSSSQPDLFDGDVVEREATLRRASGSALSVLLSSRKLPEHVGGRVFVASDYTSHIELQRLRGLQDVFRIAAMEGRVPLALAASWLKQLAQSVGVDSQEVSRVMSQMARADLPLDRLMRLFASPASRTSPGRCDLLSAVRTTINELPVRMISSIDLSVPEGSLMVDASFDDVQFCVESLISFGLRTRPLSKTLQVCASRIGNDANLSVEGEWMLPAEGETEGGSADRWERKSRRDVALGESVIEQVVAASMGSYHGELPGRMSFAIRLPLTSEEALI